MVGKMAVSLLVLVGAMLARADLAPPVADSPAGRIEGRVDVRLRLGAPRARPSVRETGTPELRGRPNRRQSVVYLETAPQGAFEPRPTSPAVMDQKDETFVPYVLPILVGTTVSFLNSDPIYHNVFSLSKPRRFDLGRYPQGKSRSVRFDRPGIVRVFCEIHSHMSAFILVFSHRYFAPTDADGRYRIDAVPPGSYELVVWTDGEVRETRRISVAPERVVEANFVVGPES